MALNRNQLNKISAYVKSASAKTKELHSFLRGNRAKMSRAQLDKIRKSVSKEYKNISQVYNSIKKNIALGDIRRIASDAELDEMMDTLAVTGTSLDIINTVLNEDVVDDIPVSQFAEEDEDVTVDDVLDSLGEGGDEPADDTDDDIDDVPGSKSSASRRAVARGSYSKSRAYDAAYGRGRGSKASVGRSSGSFIDFRKRGR